MDTKLPLHDWEDEEYTSVNVFLHKALCKGQRHIGDYI